MSAARREAAAFGLLLAIAAGYAAPRARVGGDLSHFLPDGEQGREAALSRALAESELPRTLALLLDGAATHDLARAHDGLVEALRRDPEVAWVRGGVDARGEATLAELYFPRRFQYFVDDVSALQGRLRDDALRASAQALRRRLSSPAATLYARTASSDPLLAFDALLQRARDASSGLRTEGGRFVSADGRGLVVLLGTRASPFDAARQRAFLSRLDGEIVRLRTISAPGLRLRRAGAHPVTVSAEAQTRRDAQRVSALGTALVAALFLSLHRSLRQLALVAIPVASGTLLAVAAGTLLFGRLHGLTLAFGASLVGVCVDYPVHLIHHHALCPDEGGPAATRARLWQGIRLGALTTAIGVAGMGLTSFPGLRELAVFSVVGVLGALLATRALVTPLLSSSPSPSKAARRAATRAEQLVGLLASPRLRWVAPLLALSLGLLGVPRLRWDDDVRALTRVPPALAEEDRAVRAALGRGADGALVVARGSSDEEALRRNELVADRLHRAQPPGARSVRFALRSSERAAALEAALRSDPTLPARLDLAFTREGFRAGAFAPFASALRAPPAPPLTWEALRAGPLGELVRPFRVTLGRRVAYLTFLPPEADLARVRRALDGLDGVELFDQPSFLRALYARYRRRTLLTLAGGLAGVFALLWARYRRARAAAAAMAPAVLACGAALGALGVLGVRANVMSLVGVILVLSVGADYGIFMAETDDHPGARRATALSVAVAWVTTVASFGLLALSSTPPLRAIGLVTGLGVSFSLVLAPTTRGLMGARR